MAEDVENKDQEENSDGAENLKVLENIDVMLTCLLYTSPSPRDKRQSRMPSSA